MPHKETDAQRQGLLTAKRCGFGMHGVPRLKQHLGFPQQCAPGCGRLHVQVVALKRANPELRLDRRYMLAQRRARDAEPRSRFREAAHLAEFRQFPQIVDVHLSPLRRLL